MEFEPVLPLISILSRRPCMAKAAFKRLSQRWPELRLFVPEHLFDETDYYQDEFGYPLFRWWGCRRELADPSQLIKWKKFSFELETELNDDRQNRTVNIDPGYLNYSLVVLASFKHNRQKIYLGEGIYADPVLRYYAGDFRSFDWTFPDFRKQTYYSRLHNFRQIYNRLRREQD